MNPTVVLRTLDPLGGRQPIARRQDLGRRDSVAAGPNLPPLASITDF
jgi:hypothetical protein